MIGIAPACKPPRKRRLKRFLPEGQTSASEASMHRRRPPFHRVNGDIDATREAIVPTRFHAECGVAVGAGIAPTCCAPEKKSQPATRPLIVGKDQHTYEVIDGWAKLPKGTQFGNTHGVCETADGRIFFAMHHRPGIQSASLNSGGNFIRSWGQQFASFGTIGMQLSQRNPVKNSCTWRNRECTVFFKTNTERRHAFLT